MNLPQLTRALVSNKDCDLVYLMAYGRTIRVFLSFAAFFFAIKFVSGF